MSDTFKPIDSLELHEETVVTSDDFSLLTVIRVPNGLIYKFCECLENSPIFALKSTEFVPYNWNDKDLLNS